MTVFNPLGDRRLRKMWKNRPRRSAESLKLSIYFHMKLCVSSVGNIISRRQDLWVVAYSFTIEVNGWRLPLMSVRNALAEPKLRYISRRTGR